MSKQKLKKTLPWAQCEICFTSFANKHKEYHVNDCPPDLTNITYNFVKEGTLFGSVDLKTNEEIKQMSSREKDNLVFLSESAMELCSFVIGEYVLIRDHSNDFPPVARPIYPTVEKTLTSVLFTKTGLELCPFSINQKVVVSNLPLHIKHASSITIIVLNGPKSLEISSQLYNMISNSFIGRIITTGNKISLKFYGKILKFEVKLIEASTTPTDMDSTFSNLHIAEKREFFEIRSDSRWILYRDSDDYQKSMWESSSTLAGIDEEMDEIRDLINECLKKSNTYIAKTNAILLSGNSGTGKTTIATTLAKEFKVNLVTINPSQLGTSTSSTADCLESVVENAFRHAPSIILIDNIDELCPSTSKLTEAEKIVAFHLRTLFEDVNLKRNSKVFVIATSTKPDSINSALRRSGRLDTEIKIPTPSPENRKAILEELLKDIPHNLTAEEMQEISMNTHGFVGADLVSLCSKANFSASRSNSSSVGMEDFKYAMKKVTPSAMRKLQIEVPNVKWSDIGGQDKLKHDLREVIDWSIENNESLVQLGLTRPKGVLMFGPPGCSKTMIGKALATETGLNFISVKGPELFSKWVGDSERAVRELFQKAQQVSPSIIFFDEIDAIGSERSSDSTTNVQERVVSQLLTELDGITALKGVTVVAATNRPDKIDGALMRPGRLDRIVYVPLPDSNTRKEIFRIKFAKMPVSNVSIDGLVEKTEQYSGAEVNAVCNEAGMIALGENKKIQFVESRHFEAALKLITPRTPPSLIKLYDDFLKSNK